MKKIYVILAFSAIASLVFSQTTNSFTVSGKVKTEKVFSISDLEKIPLVSIGDLSISNHKGEIKGTAKAMKGVRLIDVLKEVTLDTDNPKLMSEYYFIATAADGYKVVFSWNELFNTPVGETVYIVLEKDGKKLAGTEDSILTVSTQDVRTGRRYIKNLSSIIVGRAN